MKIEIDYTIWDNKKTKIQHFKTITLTESEIMEMMKDKFKNGELYIPNGLDKNRIFPEFTISQVIV